MPFNPDKNTAVLPLISLRGLVMFPGMLLHFDAGREKSIAALSHAMEGDKEVLLVAQRDLRDEDPNESQLYKIGCTAKIRQLLKVNEDEVRVLVEGLSRVFLHRVTAHGAFCLGEYSEITPTKSRASALYKEAAMRHLKSLFEDYAEVAPRLPGNVVMTIRAADNPAYLADYVGSNLPFPVEDKQAILDEANEVKRLELVCEILRRETDILSIDMKISEKVKVQMDDNQRDYYLREQLKALNDELYGEANPHEEAEELLCSIKALKAPEEVKEKLTKEVDKLEKMPFGSQEATVVRNYLDAVIALPWGKYSTDKISIKKASAILEREHYGLKKVKERILEALSVHELTGKTGSSILCLVGPPGVGKTSIARSVAHCMGRRFGRVSLGGVHDEAEIRGHRRTYIGAMPGRVIDAVSTAGTANPVILLDEIDKLGSDYKGDPSSALLEALDPEQNNTFKDHYIDLPFDLSHVMFITTANTTETIPAPLLDRMEIIELSGYTRLDKLNIAKKHLVKKQLQKHGLSKMQVQITPSALTEMIDHYTREAGVRKLEQCIAAVCRKCALKIVEGETECITVRAQELKKLLGNPRFHDDQLLPYHEVGVVNGLAWTQVGGTLLPIEVSVLDGSGTLELTGSLGDVMQESAKTALSYVRSIAELLHLPTDFYKNHDFHINATEGAIPKDGPSAGITMVTALVSALTENPVRRDVAMTGEITLRGRILPIGGLNEKSMAAYTAGVKRVYIPVGNTPDLDEIDPKVRESVEFVPVTTAWEVLSTALVNPIKKDSLQKRPPKTAEKSRLSARQ